MHYQFSGCRLLRRQDDRLGATTTFKASGPTARPSRHQQGRVLQGAPDVAGHFDVVYPMARNTATSGCIATRAAKTPVTSSMVGASSHRIAADRRKEATGAPLRDSGDPFKTNFTSASAYDNWPDCIRAARNPFDVEVGHRSVTVCHPATWPNWARVAMDPPPKIREHEQANRMMADRCAPWTL